MLTVTFSDLPDGRRSSGPAILAFVFFLGCAVGVWFSGSTGESFSGVMRAAVSSRVSFVGLMSAMVLPLLFSAFAVYLEQPVLLIPIAFWKAFLFSCLGYSMFTAWNHAGWLIAGLMMFGRGCAMPVLYWYWLRHIGGRKFELTVFLMILGILLVFGAVDYYLIVPFLARITTF